MLPVNVDTSPLIVNTSPIFLFIILIYLYGFSVTSLLFIDYTPLSISYLNIKTNLLIIFQK